MRAAGSSASVAGPQPNQHVLRISPYTPGESKADGQERVIKLSSNENPLGPSARAIEAYRRAADQMAIYPDGNASSLRGAIAHVKEISPDQIIFGAGSDEIISLLCMAFCEPGDEVIHTVHGFSMYRISALAAGAEPVAVPETDLTTDVGAILRAVTDRTKLVFIANPNNPTGTYIDAATVEGLARGLPPHVLLVLDGAYAEYMRMDDYDDGLRLVDRLPNVIVTHTFSKIHGLAALRVGWGYAPPVVVDAYNRVRGPFNLSIPAQMAAEAAIRDTAYVRACAIQNEVWRDWLTKELSAAQIEVPPSFANFILPRFGQNGSVSAASADAFLRSRGIIARRMEGYGLPDHLRISIGSSSDCIAVAAALREFVGGARE
ncbi:MAG: histidinol-phosphate transaminase [Neomegalonema sp.]|nr:histidinol-phosphate transaminase [Neomegalonema sp.]